VRRGPDQRMVLLSTAKRFSPRSVMSGEQARNTAYRGRHDEPDRAKLADPFAMGEEFGGDRGQGANTLPWLELHGPGVRGSGVRGTLTRHVRTISRGPSESAQCRENHAALQRC
jgi:hypothetical protein